jgi:hypothetical protein
MDVVAQPVMTAEQWFEAMRHARPPSVDDVPITRDGRRLDSPEAVREWLADLAARRQDGDVSASA